jgi:hypothetical protein
MSGEEYDIRFILYDVWLGRDELQRKKEITDWGRKTFELQEDELDGWFQSQARERAAMVLNQLNTVGITAFGSVANVADDYPMEALPNFYDQVEEYINKRTENV